MPSLVVVVLVAVLSACVSLQDPVLKPEPYDLVVTIPDQNGDGIDDILIISSRGHGAGGWVENQVRNCRTPRINSLAVVAGGTDTDRLLYKIEWCSDAQPSRIGIARLADGTELFFLEDDRMHLVHGVRLTTEQFEQIVKPQLGDK